MTRCHTNSCAVSIEIWQAMGYAPDITLYRSVMRPRGDRGAPLRPLASRWPGPACMPLTMSMSCICQLPCKPNAGPCRRHRRAPVMRRDFRLPLIGVPVFFSGRFWASWRLVVVTTFHYPGPAMGPGPGRDTSLQGALSRANVQIRGGHAAHRHGRVTFTFATQYNNHHSYSQETLIV